MIHATFGRDPDGVTPLTEEELNGLIPGHIADRTDLNRAEAENIAKSWSWGERQARKGPSVVLGYGFLFRLHNKMFEDVWEWAGTQRRAETSIGVDPATISRADTSRP